MFDERPSATEKEMAALRAIESLRDRRESARGKRPPLRSRGALRLRFWLFLLLFVGVWMSWPGQRNGLDWLINFAGRLMDG